MRKQSYRVLITLILLSLGSMEMKAQMIPTTTLANRSFSDHLRFGGGLGLSFGSDFFSASISPSVIYQDNPYWAAGLGLNFSYAEQEDLYSARIVGGSIIGLINPMRSLQLSAEFEELYVNRNFTAELNFADRNYWYPALFLGAGFVSGPVTIGVRYDVLYDDEDSIYSNAWMPFVRVYF